jgi:hypothetical protein
MFFVDVWFKSKVLEDKGQGSACLKPGQCRQWDGIL